MSNSSENKVVDIIGARVDRDDFWTGTNENWMDDPIADTAPMVVDGLLPQGEISGLPGAGKIGKSVAAYDLAQKIAWPMPGDEWLGGKVNVEGPVLYLSKEESRRSMTLMSRRMKSVERRDEWQKINGETQRFYLKHREEMDHLIVSDRSSVYETPYWKKMRTFMRDLKPAFWFCETVSKVLLIELTDRGQMSQAMDIISNLSSSTSVTGLMATHINKPESASTPINSNDRMRNAVSGSAAYIDGLRNHVCIRRAHQELGEYVVNQGFAEDRLNVMCVSTVGNFDECRETEYMPRVLNRGHYAEGWTDLTQNMIAHDRETFDMYRAGNKPPKAPAKAK